MLHLSAKKWIFFYVERRPTYSSLHCTSLHIAILKLIRPERHPPGLYDLSDLEKKNCPQSARPGHSHFWRPAKPLASSARINPAGRHVRQRSHCTFYSELVGQCNVGNFLSSGFSIKILLNNCYCTELCFNCQVFQRILKA